MLEVGYTTLGLILLARLKPLKESKALDHESRKRFRCSRGTIDSILIAKQFIQKRNEHGLHTWLLPFDLVKAFDRVPRELLWEVLTKQGVPQKLVSLLRSLQKNLKVKFMYENATQTRDSITGVKQGDLLGPNLFIFYMIAFMKTWRSSHSDNLCCVNIKADFQLIVRKHTNMSDESKIGDSEYLDDIAFIFDSRADCERQPPLIVNHFDRWSLQVHVGTKMNTESKSEVLFCATNPRCYKDSIYFDGANLSPFRWDGRFHIPVVVAFKYLSNHMCKTCTYALDVRSRIESAAKAFGALRKCLFSSKNISAAANRVVYVTVILPILLYGCECWSLMEKTIS